MKRTHLVALVATFILVTGAAVVHADTLKVPGQFATIQAAVDAAGTGDIILVSKGVHAGPVLIEDKTDVTLKGKGKAILDGGLTVRDCHDVTVTKLIIRSAAGDAALVEGGDDVGIWKIRFPDPNGCAVVVEGSQGAWVEKCVIENPG